MADRVRAGSDVRAGTYVCTKCSHELRVESSDLPPCRDCGNREWLTLSGGDRTQDLYPDRVYHDRAPSHVIVLLELPRLSTSSPPAA